MQVLNVVNCMALISVCCVGYVDAKRVLMIPAASLSHTRYHTNVARALNKLGHEVWVTMTPFLIAKADQNKMNTEGLTILEYTSDDVDVEKIVTDDFVSTFWSNSSMNVKFVFDLAVTHEDKMLRDEKFIEDVRKLDPDLIILDNLPFTYMMSVLAYKLEKPFAFIGTLYTPQLFKIPYSPAAFPLLLLEYSYPMSFKERVINTFFNLAFTFYQPFWYSDAVSRYAPERPYISMNQLLPLADITLVETDHILDYPQPVLPNVIRIGGTAAGVPVKPLKEPFKSFVESAEHGVILVTFGTTILNIPEYVSQKMFDAFSRTKFKVVWRLNATSPNPQKIMTSLWVPQNDLMGHPKVKVFVSHCGKNGQYEALHHAMPFLCLPVFGDQIYNAARTRVKGLSLTSDLRTITSDELVALVTELHDNKSYKANIQKASAISKEVQGVPMDKAAFWFDHVMKYGGEYMRYGGQVMPAYQFYCLDVLAFFMSVVFVCCGLLYCVVCRIIHMCKSKNGKKKSKKE